jgi:hypothetical protein
MIASTIKTYSVSVSMWNPEKEEVPTLMNWIMELPEKIVSEIIQQLPASIYKWTGYKAAFWEFTELKTPDVEAKEKSTFYNIPVGLNEVSTFDNNETKEDVWLKLMLITPSTLQPL